MAEKTQTTKQTKSDRVARTVKVSTLVKLTVSLFVVIGVFAAGFYLGGEDVRNHNQQVRSEAAELVTDLKASQ